MDSRALLSLTQGLHHLQTAEQAWWATSRERQVVAGVARGTVRVASPAWWTSS